MPNNFGNWKTDNYKFVGKAFDFAYADRLNKLSPIVGEVNAKSIDHELTGSGAEIGHLVLNRDETVPCNCGKRGCVEQYCSATGIVRLAKRHLDSTDAPSSLHTLKNLTCKDIFDAGKAGDKEALMILDQYYAYMGEFLGNVCSTVDPEVVVIGGGVSKAGQVLIDGIVPYFHKYVFHAASGARFTLASLGNDAGAYGAFKLALDAFHA